MIPLHLFVVFFVYTFIVFIMKFPKYLITYLTGVLFMYYVLHLFTQPVAGGDLGNVADLGEVTAVLLRHRRVTIATHTCISVYTLVYLYVYLEVRMLRATRDDRRDMCMAAVGGYVVLVLLNRVVLDGDQMAVIMMGVFGGGLTAGLLFFCFSNEIIAEMEYISVNAPEDITLYYAKKKFLKIVIYRIKGTLIVETV